MEAFDSLPVFKYEISVKTIKAEWEFHMLKCCTVLTAFPLPKPSPGDFGNFTAQTQIGICRFTTHILRQELSFTLLDTM